MTYIYPRCITDVLACKWIENGIHDVSPVGSQYILLTSIFIHWRVHNWHALCEMRIMDVSDAENLNLQNKDLFSYFPVYFSLFAFQSPCGSACMMASARALAKVSLFPREVNTSFYVQLHYIQCENKMYWWIIVSIYIYAHTNTEWKYCIPELYILAMLQWRFVYTRIINTYVKIVFAAIFQMDIYPICLILNQTTHVPYRMFLIGDGQSLTYFVFSVEC